MSLVPTQSYHSEESPPDSPRFIRTSLDFTNSNLFDDENGESQHEEEQVLGGEYYDDHNRELFCSYYAFVQLEDENNEPFLHYDSNGLYSNFPDYVEEGHNEENSNAFLLQYDDSGLSSSFLERIGDEHSQEGVNAFLLQHDDSGLSNSFVEHVEEEHNQESDLPREDSFSITNESDSMPNSHDLYYLSDIQLNEVYQNKCKGKTSNKENGYSGDDESDSPPESSSFYIFKDLSDEYQISTIKEEEQNDGDDEPKVKPQH